MQRQLAGGSRRLRLRRSCRCPRGTFLHVFCCQRNTQKDSRASFLPGYARTPRSRDTKPTAPKPQAVARTFSITRWAVVQTAPQSHEGSVSSLLQPLEEDMDCILTVSQFVVSSISRDATGKDRDTSKKKPIRRITVPNDA